MRQLNRYGPTGEENSQKKPIVASLELITKDDLQVLAHWNAATFADERVVTIFFKLSVFSVEL